MTRLLEPKLALARAIGTVSRLRGGGGTSAPGKTLLRLEPAALGLLAGRLPRGSALISATNGKTTTAAMAASIFEHAGIDLVHNRAGANMAGGIASTLLAAARPGGGIQGELGLFEVDELWLRGVAGGLEGLRAILLGNLFRDQLDRYGELEAIADSWAATLGEGPARSASLVLNADDPLVADLGRERAETQDGGTGAVVYFGIQDDTLALAGLAHAADAKHCRNCGTPYEFDAVYLGHLGHYHCPGCDRARPAPAVYARKVELEGVRSARFQLCTPAGASAVRLGLPGLYNVYNALAAAALAFALEVPLTEIVAGLQATRAAFGRAETVAVGGRELRIMLVKNPTGANEVLRTLAIEPGEHDLLGVLNDNIADGRDVSWIWDADYELLAGRVRRVTCAGTRASELALRLKYAGIDARRIVVRENLAAALDEAVGEAPARESVAGEAPAREGVAGAASVREGVVGEASVLEGVAGAAPRARAGGRDEHMAGGRPRADGSVAPLYALPTYTAMLALRELLVARGEASSSWR